MTKLDFRLASCVGKVRFETYALAQSVAHRSSQNQGGKRAAYRCPLCHGYHCGEPMQKRPSRRAAQERLSDTKLVY